MICVGSRAEAVYKCQTIRSWEEKVDIIYSTFPPALLHSFNLSPRYRHYIKELNVYEFRGWVKADTDGKKYFTLKMGSA